MINMEGFRCPEEVYYYVRKLQLDNILNMKEREVILCDEMKFSYGVGENLIPDDVLLAFVEYKNGNSIKGLIVNDIVILPFGEEGFIVAEEDENFVIVGVEMIYDFRNKNIPYIEKDLGEISTNQEVWRNDSVADS